MGVETIGRGHATSARSHSPAGAAMSAFRSRSPRSTPIIPHPLHTTQRRILNLSRIMGNPGSNSRGLSSNTSSHITGRRTLNIRAAVSGEVAPERFPADDAELSPAAVTCGPLCPRLPGAGIRAAKRSARNAARIYSARPSWLLAQRASQCSAADAAAYVAKRSEL